MNKLSILGAHLKSMLRHPVAYLAARPLGRGRTDVDRWANSESLKEDWDERTALIATMIPSGTRVIEFGAARLVLPKFLAADCQYQPVDLVSRSPETLVFDLNQELPELPGSYDYAVFSGVLEYVVAPSHVFTWLRGKVRRIVFSYAVSDYLSDPITRRKNGWINDFTKIEVDALISKAELQCLRIERWRNQLIFVCEFPTE